MAVRSQAAEAPVAAEEPPMPKLFDGTTRLYFSPMCPYAQRVCIGVNYKGLNEVEWVEINLTNKPSWYKTKVYPEGKVPALEHKGQVKGESLDLLEYLDANFSGPLLLPQDEAKRVFAKDIISRADNVVKSGYSSLSEETLTAGEIEERFGPALQEVEEALEKYPEGPFFLGDFSVVDCVYIPFFERWNIAFKEIHASEFDMASGRPHLAKWLEAIDGVDAYTKTKVPKEKTKDIYARMLAQGYFKRIFSNNSAQSQTAAASEPVTSKAA